MSLNIWAEVISWPLNPNGGSSSDRISGRYLTGSMGSPCRAKWLQIFSKFAISERVSWIMSSSSLNTLVMFSIITAMRMFRKTKEVIMV